MIQQDFIKPTIVFNGLPLVAMWIKCDYESVSTALELVNFIHKGLNEIETSDNPVRVETYKKVIYPLYSMNVGKSYESQII